MTNYPTPESVEGTSTIPNPILNTTKVQEEEYAWDPKTKDLFLHLFDELVREIDIISRHEAKLQKIRSELKDLMERGPTKKSKKAKKK